MSFLRLFVRSSSLLAVVLSLTFASSSHAATISVDVNGGKGGLWLVGNDVIPGPGETSGAVTGSIAFKRNQVSFAFQVKSLTGRITHIGIYHGAINTTGPEVIVLSPLGTTLSGTVAVDPAIVRAVSSDKVNYYVMITTDAYPGGAVRAQLASY